MVRDPARQLGRQMHNDTDGEANMKIESGSNIPTWRTFVFRNWK